MIQAYEKARAYSQANPAELKQIIAGAAKLSEPVAARQLERTDLSTAAIGERQRKTIEEAGLALQKEGVIAADVNVPAVAAALVDSSFVTKLGVK